MASDSDARLKETTSMRDRSQALAMSRKPLDAGCKFGCTFIVCAICGDVIVQNRLAFRIMSVTHAPNSLLFLITSNFVSDGFVASLEYEGICGAEDCVACKRERLSLWILRTQAGNVAAKLLLYCTQADVLFDFDTLDKGA